MEKAYDTKTALSNKRAAFTREIKPYTLGLESERNKLKSRCNKLEGELENISEALGRRNLELAELQSREDGRACNAIVAEARRRGALLIGGDSDVDLSIAETEFEVNAANASPEIDGTTAKREVGGEGEFIIADEDAADRGVHRDEAYDIVENGFTAIDDNQTVVGEEGEEQTRLNGNPDTMAGG